MLVLYIGMCMFNMLMANCHDDIWLDENFEIQMILCLRMYVCTSFTLHFMYM